MSPQKEKSQQKFRLLKLLFRSDFIWVMTFLTELKVLHFLSFTVSLKKEKKEEKNCVSLSSIKFRPIPAFTVENWIVLIWIQINEH